PPLSPPQILRRRLRRCGGRRKVAGTRPISWCRTRTPRMRPGCMPTCTASRAILAMPITGTGERAGRRQRIHSKPSGSGSSPRYWRSDNLGAECCRIWRALMSERASRVRTSSLGINLKLRDDSSRACKRSRAIGVSSEASTDHPLGGRERGGFSGRAQPFHPLCNSSSREPAMNVPVTPGKLIKGATGDWEIVIGMEVHAQVTSRSKLFSGASTVFGGEPNDHVSLVDAAMPGMLPVINEECVRQAVRTGLGLNAKINLRSVFDRKNYFYPDLPQGYQISQYKSPIVGEGEVTVELDGGKTATIGIERLHLEQDAGKLLHDQSPTMSYVDLNRSGVALMELVSKPDIRDAEQAKAYVSKVRSILRYLGTCDGDMEKGNLRADVNVSVRRPGEPLGTRCEIKNMNSVTFIGQAIEYEARRQVEILEDGGIVEQETRLFDPNKVETRSMRTKEEAHDYRYFPDPDLLPLELSQDFVDELKAELPELPDQKRTRFLAELGLSAYDASVLVAERESADFYEAVLAELKDRRRDGKAAANWVINELFGRLNKEGKVVSASPVDAGQLAAIVGLIGEGTISGKIAKDLFEIVWQEGGDPRLLVEARGLKQVTDVSAIETVVDDIISANPDKVAQAKAKPA